MCSGGAIRVVAFYIIVLGKFLSEYWRQLRLFLNPNYIAWKSAVSKINVGQKYQGKNDLRLNK